MLRTKRSIIMNTVTIKYDTSVLVDAGWRSVTVTAQAEKISEKRAKVISVIDVDGEGNTGYASRTGANRQKYNVGYVAKKETGKVKILSKCQTIN